MLKQSVARAVIIVNTGKELRTRLRTTGNAEERSRIFTAWHGQSEQFLQEAEKIRRLALNLHR
jgi:hypothetical protein